MEHRHAYSIRPRFYNCQSLSQREQRLRRLEALLNKRTPPLPQRKRMSLDDDNPETGSGGRSRGGFTLVELMLVLAVAMILISMAIAQLSAHLQKSAVRNAAADFLGACATARQMAMNNRDANVHYGVQILDDSAGSPARLAVVINRRGQVEEAKVKIGTADESPLFAVEIPASVVIWTGDEDLRSAGVGELSWFYTNESGEPRLKQGAGLSDYSIAIGRIATPILRDWDQPGYTNKHAPVLAPSTTEFPGLSLTTIAGEHRTAIGVSITGIAFSDTHRSKQQDDLVASTSSTGGI